MNALLSQNTAVALSPVTDLTLSGQSWTTRAAADPYFIESQARALVRSYLNGAEDTSVPIDLERAELIASAFRLSATFAVPDVLYERELRDYGGEDLVKLGLRVESLDGDGVEPAMRHRQVERHLTVPDSFALALAKRNGWTLLTGDGPLRELAKEEGVDCHGVLWLFDQFETQGAATYVQLHGGLEKISAHPRCRLPKREIAIRLSRYAERL